MNTKPQNIIYKRRYREEETKIIKAEGSESEKSKVRQQRRNSKAKTLLLIVEEDTKGEEAWNHEVANPKEQLEEGRDLPWREHRHKYRVRDEREN